MNLSQPRYLYAINAYTHAFEHSLFVGVLIYMLGVFAFFHLSSSRFRFTPVPKGMKQNLNEFLRYFMPRKIYCNQI
jgi:hypothetical protein